jgi:hypothetical protein
LISVPRRLISRSSCRTRVRASRSTFGRLPSVCALGACALALGLGTQSTGGGGAESRASGRGQVCCPASTATTPTPGLSWNVKPLPTLPAPLVACARCRGGYDRGRFGYGRRFGLRLARHRQPTSLAAPWARCHVVGYERLARLAEFHVGPISYVSEQ